MSGETITIPNTPSLSSIGEYEGIKNWLLGFDRKSHRNYTRTLEMFCDFSQLNPDQLLEEIVKDRREIHNKLKKFYHKLLAEGYAPGGVRLTYYIIRSFFSHNDYPLGRTPLSFRLKAEHERGRLHERQEILEMMSAAPSIRNRTIISFLAQSGQRIGILSALRYGHVHEQLVKGVSPIVIRIVGGLTDYAGDTVNKGGLSYSFAIGRECADHLRRMMRQRIDFGEPIDDDSWLFRSELRRQTHPDGKSRPHRIRHTERAHPLTLKGFHFVVCRAATIAGLQSTTVIGKNRRNHLRVVYEVHPHIFRRFWKHAMREGGVTDPDLLGFMMGQRSWRQAYDRFDPDYIRKEYAKAEPYLSFSLTSQTSNLPEIAQTNGKNQDALEPLRQEVYQRIVTEEELEPCLTDGYRYVATLPSGRIVIENNA